MISKIRLLKISMAKERLLFVGLVFTSIHVLISRVHQGIFFPQFDVGEWLISYKGGFVRRGFFGEILLGTFNLSQPIAGIVLLLIQYLLYLTIVFFLFLFIRKNFISWSKIALCCSPAVGLFIFNNYGWTRKELLGIFSLVILSISYRIRYEKYEYLSWIAIIFFAISCFSSEVNALMLPAFLYVLYVNHRDNDLSKFYNVKKILFFFISVLSLVFSTIFHGNAKVASILCKDAISHGFPQTICGYSALKNFSAIDWMQVSLYQSISTLGRHFPNYLGYFPLILFSGLPILLTPWFRTYWRWCLACSIFILPLFLIALDYGRWTFILALEIVIMIIATKDSRVENKFWNKFTTPFFVLGWGLPGYVAPDASLNNFLYLHNFIAVVVNSVNLGIKFLTN